MQPTSLEQVQATNMLSQCQLAKYTRQMLKLEKVFCRVVNCITCLLQLEEEEARDSFDVDVAVTNPEKVGQCLFILHFSVLLNYDEAVHNF